VDQLWAIRFEPGTANLADAYTALVLETAKVLDVAGFERRAVLVVDLYRPERGLVFYGNVYTWMEDGVLKYEVPGLAPALLRESERSGPVPDACPGEALASTGATLGFTVGAKPHAVLAGIMDHGPRPRAYGDWRCGDPAALYAGADASWLAYADGPMERAQTRLALLATSEELTAASQWATCFGTQGFPATALDVVAPSPLAFHGPWSRAMSALSWELPVSEELCGAIGGAWSRELTWVATGWASSLGVAPR
jgi:hypothetical protein